MGNFYVPLHSENFELFIVDNVRLEIGKWKNNIALLGLWIIYSGKLATFRLLKPLKSLPLNYMFSLINLVT